MKLEIKNLLPLDKCIKGRVYKLRSRNLKLGVYDGNGGFIGIRSKFGDRYLFTEFHYDADDVHGTVRGTIDTGVDLPDDIESVLSFGSIDYITKRKVSFKHGAGWYFIDTGLYTKDIRPVNNSNKKLFQFLNMFEES